MSLEDFELIDNETFDKSILKKDFLKMYHQQGAHLNDPDQNIEFVFSENGNYHQIGNSYLQYDLTVRKHDNTNFVDADVIRLMYNAVADCFKEGRLSTMAGSDLEHEYLGAVLTFMSMLTSKDDDLSGYFDKAEGKAFDNSFILKQSLINNHEKNAKKGKIKGQLVLEHIFGFFKSFEKMKKNRFSFNL